MIAPPRSLKQRSVGALETSVRGRRRAACRAMALMVATTQATTQGMTPTTAQDTKQAAIRAATCMSMRMRFGLTSHALLGDLVSRLARHRSPTSRLCHLSFFWCQPAASRTLAEAPFCGWAAIFCSSDHLYDASSDKLGADISFVSSRGVLSVYVARHARYATAGVFLHVEDRGPKHNAAT